MPQVRIFLVLVLAAGACAGPPQQGQDIPFADAGRGKQAIDRVGCAGCHTISGVRWPRGQAGPPLQEFGSRALIAGRIPNTPGNLAAFIRNAPAWLPGTTMPAMPVSDREASDIAAYLYELEN